MKVQLLTLTAALELITSIRVNKLLKAKVTVLNSMYLQV